MKHFTRSVLENIENSSMSNIKLENTDGNYCNKIELIKPNIKNCTGQIIMI